MSVEDFNHCSKLKVPIVRHKETVKLDYDSDCSATWNTETQEIFVSPNVENQKIGNGLIIFLHV
jgi:hypothetical protein